MAIGSTALAVIILSVLMGIACFVGLLLLVPMFLQKQKALNKRKQVQKKATEEMVRNIRYRSPSTVGIQPQLGKTSDYGSTQLRHLDNPSELLLRNVDVEKNELPSINITCDEESISKTSDVVERNNKIQLVDNFLDKNSIQSNKRRFSSIVFTHSDEIKVMSDGDSLEISTDKRERRASMSLFDTCKLACPDLSQNLGHSTEHLNQMILPINDNQGKLYFMLAQKDGNKGVLEVIIIKITDIADRKQKEYLLQMELVESEMNIIYSNETSVKVCSGEVVNFDETFLMDVDGKIGKFEDDDGLYLVFTLISMDSKKGAKSNRIGEIRFDLMELIEGHVLRFDGQEQFVICRHFVSFTNKIKSKESSGKVLIFLRFSKVSPLNFVIGIAELKDLKSTKPFSSVSVRISLATEVKVLESKRSKVIKKKHQTAEGILKLDESFEFNMTLHKLSHKDLSKSPFHCSSENVFVTLFICGRNNIGFSHVLGKCVLGSIEFADGTGLFHWNKAISNLGDIVYQWHNLKN